jgi:hypothetical protein
MTQDDCKLITEKLLGEKWLDPCVESYEFGIGARVYNRTFTTPQDFFACFEKLVELGRWNLFMHYAMLKYDGEYIEYRQMAWLLSRTESGHYRLCVLCAEWLKGK